MKMTHTVIQYGHLAWDSAGNLDDTLARVMLSSIAAIVAAISVMWPFSLMKVDAIANNETVNREDITMIKFKVDECRLLYWTY